MIKRFRVQNYKALRDVTLDLTPIHVLIGPNDSGKTSILEAVAALSRSVDHSVASSFLGDWKGRELVWNGDRTLDVRLGIQAPDVSYRLAYTFESTGRIARITEEIIGESSGSLFFEDNAASSRVCRVASVGKRDPELDIRVAEDVHDALSGVYLARWYPPLMALPVQLAANRRYRIDPNGFGLAVCLDNILGYDRSLFTRLEEELRRAFPKLETIRLPDVPAFAGPPDESLGMPPAKGRDGKGLAFKFSGMEEEIPASQVSDGLLLILGYLTLAHLPKRPSFILIEEPENGVHPERLETVVGTLRHIAANYPHTQIVLSTHSPYVVSQFKPEEVTLCRKQDDGSIAVRRLDESKLVRDQIDLFTLGEIWTSEGDEALAKPVNQDQEQEAPQ